MNHQHEIPPRNGLPILYGLALCLATMPLGCNPQAPIPVKSEPPVVSISQPIKKQIIDYDYFTGRVEAVQTVEVRARVRGELIKVHFKDGDLVKAGDPLFDIDPRTYKAELAAAEAQKANAVAKFNQATAEYNRTFALVKQNAASQSDLDSWTAKKGIAVAEKMEAEASIQRAKLDLEFAKIKSPISGRIGRPLLTEGNQINASGGDNLLTTIVSTNPMYVYFDVDERALLQYQKNRRAELAKNGKKMPDQVKDLKIPVQLGLAIDKQSFPYNGILDFSENRLDPNTGTIRVRAVFNNDSGILTPGLFARVRVQVSDPYEGLLVSERAIGTDQGQKYVLFVDKDNKVKYQLVQPGRAEGDLRIFKPGESGVKADDWIIVNGLQRVRPGVTVNPDRVPMPSLDLVAGSNNNPGGEKTADPPKKSPIQK